jgi:hypothetical protein
LSAVYGNAAFTKRLPAITPGTVEVQKSAFKFRIKITPTACGLPRLTHRIVRTYLDKRVWQDLLGNFYHAAPGPESWLRLGTKALLRANSVTIPPTAESISHDLSIVNTDYEFESYQPEKGLHTETSALEDGSGGNSHESPSIPKHMDPDSIGATIAEASALLNLVDKDRAQRQLLGFFIPNLPYHAVDYEDMSHSSSLGLIRDLLEKDEFATLHTKYCSCSDFSLFFEVYKLSSPQLQLGLVHVAVRHGLVGFVEGYLQHVWTTLNGISSASTSETHITQPEQTLGTQNFQNRIRIWRAVARSTPAVVQAIFDFQRSKAREHIPDPYHCPTSSRYVAQQLLLDPPFEMSHSLLPHWTLRAVYGNLTTKTRNAEDVLHTLFKYMRIDINGECGPSGGVVHDIQR